MLPYHILGMDNFVETGSAVGKKKTTPYAHVYLK